MVVLLLYYYFVITRRGRPCSAPPSRPSTASLRSTYGKYVPHQRFNVDQVPLPFISKHTLALDAYGEDDGWVLLEPQ